MAGGVIRRLLITLTSPVGTLADQFYGSAIPDVVLEDNAWFADIVSRDFYLHLAISSNGFLDTGSLHFIRESGIKQK